MSAPTRIQRKRTKGWRMPEGAIYVGRGSKWGNPIRVVEAGSCDVVASLRSQWRNGPHWHSLWPEGVHWCYRTADEATARAVEVFRIRLTHGLLDDPWLVRDVAPELAGQDLACWCPLDQPCHADVLLDLANGERK